MVENLNVLENVHRISKKLIADSFSDEEPYFETVWQVMHSLIEKWREIPLEEWPLVSKKEIVLDRLGLSGQTKELITPLIIGVVSATIFHIWGTKLDDPDRQVLETIEAYATRFGLRGKPKETLIENFPGFLRKITEEIGEIEKPYAAPPEREYTAEEILDPEFEFKDKLELGWEKGSPIVMVHGEEIRLFRNQERLFAVLLALAAVKKIAKTKGDEWRGRDAFLDPKGQSISKIRNFFTTVDFSNIPSELRGEIIKAWKGKVKLALRRDNIIVDQSVTNFVSRHKYILEKLLVEAQLALKSFKKEIDNLRKLNRRIKYNSGRYERNTELVLEALRLLGLESKGEGKETFQKMYNIVDRICKDLYESTKRLESEF